MSYWTYIVATFDIDTYIEDKNIKAIVEEKLKNAPKITGSEGNADIFVNVLSGHNIWNGADCKVCSYKDTVVHHEEGGYTCDADEDYKCPISEYQTKVSITVVGSLRDRMKQQTKEEYNAFVNFLKKDCNFYIDNKAVNIIGY